MRGKSLRIALSLSLAALMVSDIRKAPDTIAFDDYRALDMVVSLPKNEKAEPTPEITSDFIEREVQDLSEYDSYLLELEPLGKYYITAYSPQETGSWQTASGIKLHRASFENRYTEPTTCAVDPKLHKIGKNGIKFYIEEFDRVFIAQDTGSAVKGRHLDLAYTDLKSVKAFPTGKYQVYRVVNITRVYAEEVY
jgi:3D (Asp-Asp-Asp) domain-containing protein